MSANGGCGRPRHLRSDGKQLLAYMWRRRVLGFNCRGRLRVDLNSSGSQLKLGTVDQSRLTPKSVATVSATCFAPSE